MVGFAMGFVCMGILEGVINVAVTSAAAAAQIS